MATPLREMSFLARCGWILVAASLGVMLCFLANTAHALDRLVTVTGTSGVSGSTGDGGSAYAARLNGPTGVIFDAAGNLIISDNGNARVRRVATDDTVTTIVGTGVAGFSGDGGQAVAAQLRSAHSTAIDAAGNLYIADIVDHRIRKVTIATGIITTFAGTGTAGSLGDGGQATNAQLNQPVAMAFDAVGNLYVTERGAHRIRRISTTGVISTIAGDGTAGFTGDGGQASSARLNSPAALAFDTAGNLYVTDTDNHRIRRITTGGVISTFAGSGASTYSGDGGAANAAGLPQPYGMRIDANNIVWVATQGDKRIRAITVAGVIDTYAGDGSSNPIPDNEPSITGQLDANFEFVFDSLGNVTYAIAPLHVVRRIIVAQPGGQQFSRRENLTSNVYFGTPNPLGTPIAYPDAYGLLAAPNVAVGSDRSTHVIGSKRAQQGSTASGPILSGNFNWRTIKYGANAYGLLYGQALLAQDYDSTFGDDSPTAIALDANNNPVVAGMRQKSGGGVQWRVQKLSGTDYSQTWALTHPTDNAYPAVIAIDAAGGIVVAGHTPSANGPDLLIVKYAGDGTPLWQRIINGVGSSEAHAVAIDPATRDPIVVGQLANAQGSAFVSLRLAEATGNVVWQQSFDVPGNHSANAVAIDSAGAIFIAGLQTLSGGASRTRIEKRAADGTLLWTYLSTADSTAATSVALDPSGDVVVGGFEYRNSTHSSLGAGTFLRQANWIARLAGADGAVVWTRTFFTGTSHAQIRGLKLGLDRNPVVMIRQTRAGAVFNPYTAVESWHIAKLNAFDGSTIWTQWFGEDTFGTTNNRIYRSGGLAVNGESVVVASTQYTTNNEGGGDDPVQQYTIRFENPNQQVIGFPALSDRAYSPTPFSVSPAGVSSAVPVVVASTTPLVCSTSGTNGLSVTMLSVGVCTLRATQLGSFRWRAATPVERSFNIALVPQAINFAALANKVFEDAPFTIAASGGGSGNPVTFSSLTVSICTVGGANGTTVTIIAAGTCTIRANQAGDSLHAAAPAVNQTFAVAQASQTITFALLPDRVFTPGASTLVATGGASGNAVTFASLTPGICTTTGTALNLIIAGTCTIRASQAASVSYSAAPSVDRSFTITRASQTITFPTQFLQSRVFQPGFQFPVYFEASASSGLGIGYTTSNAAVCTVSGITLTMVGAGICAITANQAGNGSYFAATPVTQNVTIDQAPQTITFSFQSDFIVGGQTTLIASGGASGNAIAFTNQTPSICTIAGSTATGLAVGLCTVEANQAGNSNYLAAPTVTRSVYVNFIPQTINFGTIPAVIALGQSTTLSATGGGSGQPVVFGNTTPTICSNSGTNGATLIGLAAGTCVVTANQAGNATFSAAPQITRQVLIGIQNIGFFPPAVFIGTSRVLTATGGGSGSPVVFTSATPLICTTTGVNGTILTRIADGACSVTANQAAGNGYNAAAPVTVTIPVPQRETLAASVLHTLAIKSDGTVWSTGDNSSGQLGDGTTTTRFQLVQVANLTNAVAVTASTFQSAAIRADGTLWRWGLGSASTPTMDTTAPSWIAVAACDNCMIALTADGTAWVWDEMTSAPRQIDGQWAAVAATPFEFVLLSRTDGSLWRLERYNTTMELIDNARVWTRVVTSVDGGSSISNTKFAMPANGTLWAWDYNGCRQYGDGNYNAYPSPTLVSTRTDWAEVKPGSYSTVARRTDGSLWGWGCNDLGQLGLGAGTEFPFATQIASGTANNWEALAAGGYHFVARRSDGTLWGSGYNDLGQLGNGGSGNVNGYIAVPVQSLHAPVIGTATAGAGSATVNFSPLGATYNPITGYRAVSMPGGISATCTVPCSSIVVSGLTAGTSYTFTVAAINGSGSGSASAASNSVTPTAAPTTFTVTPSVVVGGSNGTITPSVAQTVTSGATSAFTVTPNSGYSASVGGSCGGSLVGTTYTTSAVTANCTVEASFRLLVALSSVVSRKTHGAAGVFEIVVNPATAITGNVNVDPRIIGSGHTIVFTYNQAIASVGTASATDTAGNPIGAASAVVNPGNANEVLVTLTGIPDASRVLVSVAGVAGAIAGTTTSSAAMGFLVGDVNQSRAVNASDITAVKNAVGQATDGTNFTRDVNASGTINASDLSAVKTRAGASI